MLFNSYTFLVLLALTSVLYYQKFLSKYQIHILILSSFVFYAWYKPILLTLLLFCSAINIVTSYLIVYSPHLNKKIVTTLGVGANLFILAFFKYSPLIASTFFDTSQGIGSLLVSIPLPIGISFFTFQGISLMVDVYKGNHFESAEIIPKSFFLHAKNILFFKAFFPQLISGPIVKAHDFLPQIKTKYFRDINWERVFKSILTGYFLKMVVADNLKDFTFWIEYPYFEAYNTIDLFLLLIGYSCQIFADFAGYSLIAIGIADLFGYRFKDNFNFPYIASSFRDFWKRWHISLSTFLMEYLYYPLGGNRKGKVRTYINLFIVMALGGLWHGAAWSYMVWGFAHGLFLATERFIFDKFKIVRIESFIYSMFVFIVVSFAWLLFKLPDFSHVILYIQTMFAHPSLTFDKQNSIYILIYCSPILVFHLIERVRFKIPEALFVKFNYVAYGIMLFLITTNSGSSGSFIYFKF